MRNASPNAPRTIAAFLDQLRQALEGAPKGLIQDALADAEEHLRNEMAQNPGKSEAEILVQVLTTYGSPRDVAAEYRKLDANGNGHSPAVAARAPRSLMGRIFGPVFEGRTYASILYMLLALPLGTFYFSWATTGISLSLGLMILIIGIPVTLIFIFSVRIIALVEGRIVETLLGVRMPRRLPSEVPQGPMLQRIKRMVTDRRTWTAMFYMLLMLPLGTAYFVLAVISTAFFSALMAGPIITKMSEGRYKLDFGVERLNEFVMSPQGMATCIVLGLIGFLFFFHIARGVGRAHGKLAESLLVKI
ncbi:MAG TPA: sensor domain-containing protein [Micropepsaceae bacterium]|nr:sensor domain-containing protein [Micropepsaceae bacterium]